MITQTAEYALRAVVALAQNPGSPLTTSQMAEITRVPAGYLSKVLQVLGRAGLVKSSRGLHGGFELRCDPAKTSVLEVVNAVDPIKRIHTCPLELKSHRKKLCPLHRRLDDAAKEVEKALASTLLEQVLGGEDEVSPLCTHAVRKSL